MLWKLPAAFQGLPDPLGALPTSTCTRRAAMADAEQPQKQFYQPTLPPAEELPADWAEMTKG